MKVSSSLKSFLGDKFITNSAGTFLLRIFGILLQFGILLLLTNYTSEVLVGKFNYLSYLIIILGAIILLGLNTSFFRFTGKLESENKSWYLKKLYLKSVTIVITGFLIVIILYLFSKVLFEIPFLIKNQELFNLIVMGIFPFSIMSLNFEVIRSYNKLFVSEIYRSLIRFGLVFVVFLGLIIIGKSEFILLAYIVILFLIAGVSTWYIIVGINHAPLPQEHKNFKLKYKEILTVSVPMTLSYMSLLLMQSIDTVILKMYESFEVVAYYSTAMKISILINIVLIVITTVIGPKIAKLYFDSDLIALKKLMQNAVNLNVIVSLPIIILSIFLSDWVLSIFGENYVLASQAFVIILLGQIVNSLSGPVGMYLNMTNKQKIFRNILGVSLVLNILLNFLLIPQYGMIGAAIAMSVSLSLWNILGFIIVWRKDRILLFPKFKISK